MVSSIIGELITMTGDLVSKGEVLVEGEIQGHILCKSLVVGENGRISDQVVAEDVLIRGRVVGSIHSVRLMLASTSHVEGDIDYASLQIEQGAYFEGRARRRDDPIAAAGTRKESGVEVAPDTRAMNDKAKPTRACAALGHAAAKSALPIEEELTPAVSIKKSVSPDAITCLDCGKTFKSIKRHIRTRHDLSPEEYRERWGLRHDYPIVAPNHAVARSKLAKKRGSGRKPGK